MSHGPEYPSILNIPLVLHVPEFWIYQGSEYSSGFEYARVTQGSEYAWIIPEYAWLRLYMSEYAWICSSMCEYV